jgi:imidazole glycerol-phosphate synthase subunit HisH
MIAIIDYGSGNVGAIMNILRQRKIPHMLSRDLAELERADRYILPGVGAFDPTMQTLLDAGIVDVLNEQVLERGKSILGICVGMHLLADGSDEGQLPGLGWISGRVRRIDPAQLPPAPRLPHMGWNSVSVTPTAQLFDGIDPHHGFYFLHSFYFDAADPAHVAARVEYGGALPCAVERANVFGMQFHPEKSHGNGTRIFSNFAELH